MTARHNIAFSLSLSYFLHLDMPQSTVLRTHQKWKVWGIHNDKTKRHIQSNLNGSNTFRVFDIEEFEPLRVNHSARSGRIQYNGENSELSFLSSVK